MSLAKSFILWDQGVGYSPARSARVRLPGPVKIRTCSIHLAEGIPPHYFPPPSQNLKNLARVIPPAYPPDPPDITILLYQEAYYIPSKGWRVIQSSPVRRFSGRLMKS